MIKVTLKWHTWLLFLLLLSEVCIAGARVSIVRGGDEPVWRDISTNKVLNPLIIKVTGQGDWSYCEAYNQPILASAFVRCWSKDSRMNIGAYCDLINENSWKKTSEWQRKSEFHIEDPLTPNYLTVTLDCNWSLTGILRYKIGIY